MLSTNGIQAVFFDLDGTLRHSCPSAEQTFFNIAVRLGLPDSREKRLKTMRWSHEYWAQSPLLLHDMQSYPEMEDEFWVNYTQRRLVVYGCDEEQAQTLAAQVQQQMVVEYQPVNWVAPDVFSTLVKLKEGGFKLGVVSNRTFPFDDLLAELELASYFDCVFAAGAISAWKPEPDIFFHALNELSLHPDQVIYVGDNYYADVIGARRAGLRPILLDSEGVFQGADCEVIRTIGDLLQVLGN